MTRFTLAVNRTFTSQNGEREADFISCVAWRKQAENLANFMRKGNLIGIEGRIQTGSFEGQDGKRVYTTDVVADSVQFLEPRNGNGASNQPSQQPEQQYAGTGVGAGNQSYGSQQSNSGSFGNGYQNNFGNQPNYTRVDEDPFASSKGPIEVSEDDLPF